MNTLRFIALFATILIIVFSSELLAQKSGTQRFTLQQITDGIQNRYKMTDDAIAEFDQQVKFGFSRIEQAFTGTLWMAKPRSYRVHTDQRIFVTDGNTVWSYSEVNQQVLIDHYKEDQNSISPERFLLNLPKNYFTSLLQPEMLGTVATQVLKLTPKDDRSFVKSVKIWVENDTWMVRKVQIEDVNETVTTYSITSMKLNTGVPRSMFTFDPPDDSEVVDLR